jgi:Tol biopolymer transport system component
LLSLESLEKYKLTTPPALYHGDLYSAFSPDGKKLAFIRERSLYVNSIHIVPITGGESQPLYDEKHSISGLAWTRDGREIVFCGMFVGVGKGLEGLWRLAAAGGRPELVPLVAGADYVSKPTISRQGELLAYEQGKSDENIWRLDLPTVKGQSAAPYAVISSSRLDWFPNISPDGSRIVFVSNRSGSGQIWMCDSSGHDAVQLTSLTADAGSPRWSPDRQHIAFDSRPEGHSDIFMLNVDGGNPQRVTTAASDDITPSWSRDGRWIYFASNRSGNFEIWRSPVQGGDAVRITTGADGISPFESFDGKWIYYAKQEKSGIWRAPIQGGQDSLVLKFPPAGWWMPWALSVDGIYYINYRAKPGVIEFFSFATSHVTRIAELPQSLSCLAVSPDQRWLLYSQREIDTDIMLVENFR